MKKIIALNAVIACILMCFFVSIVSRGGGDDYNFVVQASQCSIDKWIYTRFMTHSGRVVAEAFIWIFARIPLVCWKVTTMLFFCVFIVYIYKYAIMFGNEKNYFLLFACAISPFWMNHGTFVDGILWVTGAMNYMWIAVPGVVGSYYAAKTVFFNESISVWQMVGSFFMMMVTISSSEQMGLVLIVLLFLAGIYSFIKHLECKKYICTLFFVGSIIYILDMVLAPGVAMRTERAIEKRIPDFLTVESYLRIEYSVRWIMDALINHMGILLNFIWLTVLVILYMKKGKNILEKFIMILLLGAESATLFRARFPRIFDFQATWGMREFSKLSYCMIAIWIGILAITGAGVISVCKSNKKKVVAELLLLASYASTAMMIFSPTMYESGCRTVFHASILMIILIFLLMSEMETMTRRMEKVGMWIILIGGGGIQWIKLINCLKDGFTIHLKW